MEYVVLGVLVVAAAVVLTDEVRQRRRRRHAVDIGALLANRMRERPRPDGGAPFRPRALSGAASTSRALEPGELAGVWDVVAERSDPEEFAPRLADGTEIVAFDLRRGDDYAMVASPDRTEHYRVEPWEAELARTLDGTRTVRELIVDQLERGGELDADAIVHLVELLRWGGMLDPAPIDVSEMVQRGLDRSSSARRKLREFGRTLSIEWSGAERFVRRTYGAGLHRAFRPVGIVTVGIIAAVGLAAFLAVVVSNRFVLELRSPPAEGAILIALGFGLTFAHELGHALAITHYGRRVLAAGFFIFFGSPAFFVDASDVLMLDARKRIVQSFAGPLAELFVAGIAAILLFALPSAPFAPLLYRFVVVNYFVCFENLIPLLRLDGYWILADLIESPDLRGRSIAFVRGELWQRLRRRARLTRQEVALALYGTVGIGFTVFSFWLGFVFWQTIFGGIVGELWDGGVGSRILLVLLLLVFVGPVIRAALGLAGVVIRRIRAVATHLRFRSEREWRIEAAHAIDAVPALADLPEDLLSDLAGRVRLRTVPANRAVIRQGDRADAFYVVRAGSAAVEEEDPDTEDVRVLRTMGPGESFGELGLIANAPRQATVRAVTDLELFEVDRGTFDRLLAHAIRAPDVAPTVQAHVELRALTPFRRLSAEGIGVLLEFGGWMGVAPGTAVIEQGAPGDAFFVIASGRADVIRDGELRTTLGPGDHFGEVALLNDAPRNASVVARTPMRLFRLDRTGFQRVIAHTFQRHEAPDARYRTMEH